MTRALKGLDRDRDKLQSTHKLLGGNTMKSSTRDEAEGKWHKVKGKIKEIAGKVSMRS